MEKSVLSEDYNSPRIEIIKLRAESIICTSPQNGESENTGEDDWGNV
jgi:hypothetical protein